MAKKESLEKAFQAQMDGFFANETPSYAQRRANLTKLLLAIDAWEDRVVSAISSDYASGKLGGRSRVETVLAETLFAKADLKYTLKHLKRWMKTKRVSTPLQYKPGRGEIRLQPKGVVGILGPWNYPFQLCIVPLIAALAAGNRVMLKPSELTPNTSALLAEMLHGLFEPDHVRVINGGSAVAARFSALPFHHLFFTGSTPVGRLVAQAAAKNLTPVTLELGGKSPAIIDASADLTRTAKRLAVGKLLNAGQTCVAADYVLIEQSRIQAFADKIIDAAEAIYPTIADNPDYSSIISDRHYGRLIELLDDAKAKGATIVQAGSEGQNVLAAARKIPLSLILNAKPEMRVCQEEIFGPLLPILAVNSSREAIAYVNKSDRPLALYWFGENRAVRENVLGATLSGGVCINDTLWQLAQENLPFGGVGASGMGAYHGQYGFKTFSHERAVFHQSKFSGGKIMYPPYTQKTEKILSLLKKIG